MKLGTLKGRRVFALGLAALMCCGTAVAQDEEHDYSGEDVYRLFCTLCHGPAGQGSPLGKPLDKGDALGKSDDELIDIVYKGRADKGMMGFGTGLSRTEIERVVMYIRQLQGRTVKRGTETDAGAATTAAPSDTVRAGEALFNGKAGCVQCHAYYTRGGTIGPALDKYGSRTTVAEIREALASPSATIADGYGGKELHRKNGDVIKGRFRYETEATIQMLNQEGYLWTTYFKSDEKSITDMETSLMPKGMYSMLSGDEQDALVAFLQSLK